MPVEEITQYLQTNRRSCKKALHMQLAIHCAPFLKGIKESAVVSLPRDQAVEFSVLAARKRYGIYLPEKGIGEISAERGCFSLSEKQRIPAERQDTSFFNLPDFVRTVPESRGLLQDERKFPA